MSDWFEHWATKGVKPVFLCEYGVPFTWDWTMYRGWYKGKRELGSAVVPWEFCLAEWNAQFLGDRAFRISETEKENLRWEAEAVPRRQALAPLGLPDDVGSKRLRRPADGVRAIYLTDNWRAYPHLGRLGDFAVGIRPSGSCATAWTRAARS